MELQKIALECWQHKLRPNSPPLARQRRYKHTDQRTWTSLVKSELTSA
jgi:hypothetical protein